MRNEYIPTEMYVEEPVHNRRRALRWYGRVQRMNDERRPRRLNSWSPPASRKKVDPAVPACMMLIQKLYTDRDGVVRNFNTHRMIKANGNKNDDSDDDDDDDDDDVDEIIQIQIQRRREMTDKFCLEPPPPSRAQGQGSLTYCKSCAKDFIAFRRSETHESRTELLA
ncbi:hypothetical protein ANN_15193 [Periplaneta americana]|uniref:Uncharacterized protein n=1 Tax=Periplaneta americana TaxID=6978 RepID=A0ABQ8SGV5_PERAM|nr:hypothetical protein ANN_15193 [Periplaneta americana]